MAQPHVHNKDMKNPALIFGARPETVAFWTERAWLSLYYLSPWFSFSRRILGMSIGLEILMCNILYLLPEIVALLTGNKQDEELKCMRYWSRKDRYAYYVERVGTLMFIVGVFLQHSDWINTSGILVGIPVLIIFPLSNFMYTPWFPFLQEEQKKIQKENQTKAMPSTEKHHHSIKQTKSHDHSNAESKHDDHSRRSHVNIVETKQPPHESIEQSNNQRTEEVDGNGEFMHDEANSKSGNNACLPLPPLFKEELSKLGYPQPHEITKTQDERTEFSLGTALETTFKTIYGNNLSEVDLSYLKLIKEFEASWERKLKTYQKNLKKARKEKEELRKEWEEERRKWGDEKIGLASALFTVKSEAAFYYHIAESNGYHYNKLMEEKNDLAAKLCEATASSEVYRSLLYNSGASV